MTMIDGPVLVERSLELRALLEAAEAVQTDGARLVLITGEAGLGKSILHTAFRRRLPPEWQVEFVDGHHTDRSFAAPFGHLAGTIDPSDEPSQALARAVGAVCRSLVIGGPTLLVIEDLHFLDPVTVLALPPLLDALEDVPVLLVATSRPAWPGGGGVLAASLAALREHPRVIDLGLEPLSERGIDELLQIGHRAPDGDRGAEAPGRPAIDESEIAAEAQDLHRRTGGNPFFVDALLRADPNDRSVPWTVSELVYDLLEDLGAAPRAAAELLAVEGGPLPIDLLDTTASVVASGDRPPSMPLPASPSAALEGSGLAVLFATSAADGVVARLRHALVAEAIRSMLDPVTVAARHRILATMMEREGSDRAEELARHWSAAGEPARSAPWARIAADRLLASGSHRRATEMYELALVYPPTAPSERAALFERAVMSAAHAGQAERAREWAEAARARDDAGPSESDRVHVNAVLLGSVEHSHLEAANAGDAAARQDDMDQADAALALMLEGDLAAADALLVAVIDRAEPSGELALASVAWSRRARLRAVAGDWGASVVLNDRALSLARQAGDTGPWAHLAVNSAFLTALAGNLDDALARCAETEDMDVPLISEMARAVRAVVSIERGHLDHARDELDALRPLVRALGVAYYSVPILCLDMRLHLMTGDRESAAHALEEIASFGGGLQHDYYTHDVMVARALISSWRARADELAKVQAQVSVLARKHGGEQWLAAVQFLAALAAQDGDASRAYASAAMHWEAAPRAGWAADAWCAAARTATTAGDHDRALARAAALADRHRLDRVQWQIAVERPREITPAPSIDEPLLTRLTERERAVVVEAARGATNREIGEVLGLSDRTVRNYLSSAFAKLGVTRRAHLADLVPPNATGRELRPDEPSR